MEIVAVDPVIVTAPIDGIIKEARFYTDMESWSNLILCFFIKHCNHAIESLSMDHRLKPVA